MYVSNNLENFINIRTRFLGTLLCVSTTRLSTVLCVYCGGVNQVIYLFYVTYVYCIYFLLSCGSKRKVLVKGFYTLNVLANYGNAGSRAAFSSRHCVKVIRTEWTRNYGVGHRTIVYASYYGDISTW